MKLPECHHGDDEEDDDHLSLCRKLLSSLSDSVSAVQSFKGRWSVVSAKLLRLRSDLSALPPHPLSSDLLRSLAETLTLALTLSLHCHVPDPPAGKLQTQSELAAVSATLDQHLSDADLLLKSGVLLDPSHASASPPRPSAVTNTSSSSSSRREVVRAECRNLVTRIQIGGAASRSAALDSLVGLLREDDKNVVIAVAQGVVPVLVRLLESSSLLGHEAKEKAVAAIARVSSVESCRYVLVAEGLLLLNHLSRVLESGSCLAKEKACAALQTLTLSKENAMAIGSRGGISSLLEICQDGTPVSQAAAAGVLKNLAAVDEIRGGFVEEKAVAILKRLCASGTAAAQDNAVGCLRNLAAAEGQDSKLLIVREFGIDSLRNYWDAQGRDIEPAVGLFRHLASNKLIAELLVSAGFVPRVVSAFDSTSSATRTEAARAVCEVAMVVKARKEIGDVGCVAKLVRMLDAKGAEEKEAAVAALATLVASADCRRVLRKEEKGIASLVQLLNLLVRDVEKKYPVSVLLAVSQSRKCRRRMVEAGACGYLQRLVDMEVEGSKKLLESLEKGKLWGVLFTRT